MVKVKKDTAVFWLLIVNVLLSVILVLAVLQMTAKLGDLAKNNANQAPSNGQQAAPTPQEPQAVKVDVGVNPPRGSKDAKVVIIEFSDFQCPFCSRVVPSLKQVEATYGDKVAVYFRNFPLSFHENAQKAAEAAECANEQGKFWEMHDKMFANQGALAIADLKGYAKAIGLDQTKFDTCLDSGKMTSVVQADFDAGRTAGVQGTPTSFINGKAVVGALPFEAFKQAIDAELAK